MGKPSRDKGARFERQIVKALNAGGIEAERVPLSGAAGGSFGGDIVAVVNGRNITIELKKLASGFKVVYGQVDTAKQRRVIARHGGGEPVVILTLADWINCIAQSRKMISRVVFPWNPKRGLKQIYSWLEGNDALVIGADRKEPLIVLPLSEWIKQVGGE